MSTYEIIGEEIDRQAALASAALQNRSAVGAGTSARQLLPRAVLHMLAPYWIYCGARSAIRRVRRRTGPGRATPDCFRWNAWLLFRVNGLDIIVAEIGPRGELYKHGP